MVEGVRGRQGQVGDGVKPRSQSYDADQAAPRVHPRYFGLEGHAFHARETPHERHSNDAPIENHLGAGERYCRVLDTDAHQREKQRGDDHPEGLHGLR